MKEDSQSSSRCTELAFWGVGWLLCALIKGDRVNSNACQHLRTMGTVIKSMAFGARWLYYLG